LGLVEYGARVSPVTGVNFSGTKLAFFPNAADLSNFSESRRDTVSNSSAQRDGIGKESY